MASHSEIPSPHFRPCSMLALLFHNREAAKSIVALGLVIIVSQVPDIFVVTDLQGALWGKNMATYSSATKLAMYTVAIFASGPLGRFGDRVGNRWAVALATVCLALPSYALLCVGLGQAGLAICAVSKVISGLAGSSLTGSPVFFALVNEVSPPEDVAPLLGLAFSGVALFMLLGSIVALTIENSFPENPRLVLVYTSVLSIVALVILASISSRPPSGKLDDPKRTSADANVSNEGIRDTTTDMDVEQRGPGNSNPAAGPQGVGDSGPNGVAPSVGIVESVRFVFGHKELLWLCITAALVSIPEVVLFDIMIPFGYDMLDLLGHTSGQDHYTAGSEEGKQRTLISVMVAFLIFLALMVGSFIAGALAKQLSSRRLLTYSIPLVALLDCVPMLLMSIPRMEVIGVSAFCLGLTLSVLTPLQAMVVQAAPPGRSSEAICAVGAFKCISSIIGNLFVSAVVPMLNWSHMPHPLWVLFPLSAALSLSALLAIRQLPNPDEVNEVGVASHAVCDKKAGVESKGVDIVDIEANIVDDISTSEGTPADNINDLDRGC